MGARMPVSNDVLVGASDIVQKAAMSLLPDNKPAPLTLDIWIPPTDEVWQQLDYLHASTLIILYKFILNCYTIQHPGSSSGFYIPYLPFTTNFKKFDL